MTATSTDRQHSNSRSPARRTLGDKISALGAKLSRTLSHTDERAEHGVEGHVDDAGSSVYGGAPAAKRRDSVDSGSTVPILKQQERSLSRGRDAFQSTGRGGLGNIRQASFSRDARPETGPDDFSVTRGREAIASPTNVYSTGRGGAGNLHSPSRERDGSRVRPTPDAAEQEVIREYVAAHENVPVSSGRGGIGNIHRSRSRDPAGSPARLSSSTIPSTAPSTTPHTTTTFPPHATTATTVPHTTTTIPPHATTHVSHTVHSTGRGGAGNIYPGDGVRAEKIDEEARRGVGGERGREAYHSTGRGGFANISSAHEPAVEKHSFEHPEYESTGRGGVGNIVREGQGDRSRSRGRE